MIFCHALKFRNMIKGKFYVFQADYFYMSQALMLAQRGRLSVSPNPMVGCIIVKNGQIIGEGWHRFAGDKHAEIHALDQAGKNSKDSTLYVTLEPCCHHGRTGACTEQLIKAQVAKVIIASIDPNPKVSGKGVKCLQDFGIEVETGLMRQEAIRLNKIFFYYYEYKLPYVIAKWGMSLDGQMITHYDDSKQITNKASQKQVHNLRNQVDAIIVGRQTVLDDNPKLTVRMSDAQFIKHPLRVVLSKKADLPIDVNLFNDKIVETMVFTSDIADKKKLCILQNQGIKCIKVSLNKNGELNLYEVLHVLAKKGISSVLVEGGPTLRNAFFSANLVSEVQTYLGAVIVGKFNQKVGIEVQEDGVLQGDYYFIGLVR